MKDKLKYSILQVDDPVDSNTSSSITPDSIDLTVFPLKGQTSNTYRHDRNAGASHDNTDRETLTIEWKQEPLPKTKVFGKTSDKAQANKAQATQLKNSKAQAKDDQTQ